MPSLVEMERVVAYLDERGFLKDRSRAIAPVTDSQSAAPL